jgi:2,4-dichlorophenol 6-monooxygenase
MGVADDIYAGGPQDDRWHKVVWYTSVGGDTPADGVHIGDVPAWGGDEDAVRYAQASPRRFANLPQLRIDPLLYVHAAAACPGRIRSGMDVVDITYDDHGVLVTAIDRAARKRRTIRAAYAIVADGGRSSEELLGVKMEGPRSLREVVNYHVRTDLSMWAEPDALLGFFFHPRGGLRRMGTIQALGPNSYDRNSKEWLVAVSGWMFEDGEVGALPAIRRMLGLPEDHPIELISESRWVYNAIVADKWRYGRVFIAGDAAHRHPPTGGLGLNSGVQDVDNLAWKLAAVLHDEADEALLDSYEVERRPTTAFYTAHSLENAARHAPIGEALGLGPDEEESRRRIAVFLSEGPEGDEVRRQVAAAVEANAHDYSQLNVEAGFFYGAGAFVPDGSPIPENADSPIAFRPTTRPGSHIPHVWLAHVPGASAQHPVSTRDLVRRTGLTLFVGETALAQWRDAVAAQTGGLPVTLTVIPDADVAWSEVNEISADGAVLVRPDAKNAWRVVHLPADPAAALQDAVAVISRGGDPAADDPAAPYFERIRRAAAVLSG